MRTSTASLNRLAVRTIAAKLHSTSRPRDEVQASEPRLGVVVPGTEAPRADELTVLPWIVPVRISLEPSPRESFDITTSGCESESPWLSFRRGRVEYDRRLAAERDGRHLRRRHAFHEIRAAELRADPRTEGV